ncbi:amino acid adenylation domain-containing protein [Nocardiopsis sp. NPDC006198]|uniref:amino acid adenylation domain-containing protein n=1 Tax=Nocardiopsis sp. NPDC006198 TaxID=3154472 RepID=UPI0033BB28AE
MEHRHGPVVDIGATTVLEFIDRERAAHPHAPAVHEQGRVVSYAELDQLADTVMGRLIGKHGIGPSDTVAIAGRAGIEFTAAVLGTLRAGAAYLPIDITYPRQRIEQIVRAGDAGLIAFTQGVDLLLERDAPRSGSTTLESLLAAPDEVESAPVRPAMGPADPAYVIFTSGSTGEPKGIVQTHRCLANFVAWQVAESGLGRGRRVLQSAPLSFDVSVQEMFYTLASGGCLYVPDKDVKSDVRALVDFIIEARIEVVDFPQSLIETIMLLPTNFRHAPALRHIVSAGEVVRITPALEELLEQRPELTIHNHYGPAENHMVASHSISSPRGNIESLPPVGSLIWNTYVHILDESGRPVADGEIGEVYIGGDGVARGYTDPVLTRSAFVPDPFRPGSRLYRTKDRGSWRPDGIVELHGRMDDLIKIRGYSVEPREVEAHVTRLPGVRSGAVFGVRRPGGAMELQAAVVGEPRSTVELRRSLLAVLPDYMVPVRWWLVEDFPFSPNGKLNRGALPGPAARPLPAVRC